MKITIGLLLSIVAISAVYCTIQSTQVSVINRVCSCMLHHSKPKQSAKPAKPAIAGSHALGAMIAKCSTCSHHGAHHHHPSKPKTAH